METKLPENFRGQPIFDIELCIGCGLCCLNCPSKAIEMVDVEGKKYPQLSLDKCIFCYLCADGCPRKAIKNSSVFELATTDKSSLVIKPQQIAQKNDAK
jgi:formate hydrogenlyase subunit 6/NADH:ubiquinone oxidoreductase subunit I